MCVLGVRLGGGGVVRDTERGDTHGQRWERGRKTVQEKNGKVRECA